MTAPTTYDILDYRAGDTLILDITVKNPSGSPIDLTGASVIRWVLQKGQLGKGSGTFLERSVANGGIEVIDAEDGRIAVTVAAGTVPKGSYTHELEVTLASGSSLTPLQGAFRANETVLTNIPPPP